MRIAYIYIYIRAYRLLLVDPNISLETAFVDSFPPRRYLPEDLEMVGKFDPDIAECKQRTVMIIE